MNEHPPYAPPYAPWQPPSPFVTHQDLGPLHSRLGAVEKVETNVLSAYNHLRGEMLHRFDAADKRLDERLDRLEALMRAQAAPATPEKNGVLTFSIHNLVLLVIALVMAGVALGGGPINHILGALP